MPRAAAPTAPRFEHRTDRGPVLAVATPTPRLSWQIPTRRRRVHRDRVRGRGDAGRRRARGVHGRVGRPGARAVAGRAARVPAGGHRARAGPRRRRGVDRLERSGGRRGRPVPRRTTGPPGSSARARSAGLEQPAPLLRGRARRAGRGGPGAAVRHGARPLPRRAQRPAGRRRRARARAGPAIAHRLRYQTYDVTDLVRAGDNVLRRPARQRLVPRPARLPRRARPLRRPPGPARPARGDHRRRRRCTCSPPTGPGPPARPTCSPTTSTTASAPTCAARPGRPRRPTRSTCVDADLGRLVAPDGPPVRVTDVLPAVAVDHLPVRQDARRLRPEPRRLGAAAGARAGRRATRSSCATPRCWRTASWASVRCGRPRPPTRYVLAGGDEVVLEPPLTFHGFRYAEVTGVAGPRRRRTSRPSWSAPTWRRTGWFDSLAPAAQPLPRQRGLGHARQLRRRADRLPAARRAARLDRRHPGLLADRRASCTTAPASSPPGSPTWRPSSRRTAPCRSSSRTCCGTPGPAGGGLGRRGDGRALGDLRAHRRRRRAARGSCRACAPGSTSIADLAGKDRLWAGGFQFGDWLDPTAPPDDAVRAPRPTRT